MWNQVHMQFIFERCFEFEASLWRRHMWCIKCEIFLIIGYDLKIWSVVSVTVWEPFIHCRTRHLFWGSLSVAADFLVFSLCITYMDKNVLSCFPVQAALCHAFLIILDSPGTVNKILLLWFIFSQIFFITIIMNNQYRIQGVLFALWVRGLDDSKLMRSLVHIDYSSTVLAMSLRRCKCKCMSISGWYVLHFKYLLGSCV